MLRQHFSNEQLQQLSQRINLAQPSGLDYYPLVGPGERFPVNDPGMQPRLMPRPDDDALFLQGRACTWLVFAVGTALLPVIVGISCQDNKSEQGLLLCFLVSEDSTCVGIGWPQARKKR